MAKHCQETTLFLQGRPHLFEFMYSKEQFQEIVYLITIFDGLPLSKDFMYTNNIGLENPVIGKIKQDDLKSGDFSEN